MYLKNILNHGKGIAKRRGGGLGLKYHDPLPHLESKYTQTKSRFSISKFLEGKRGGGSVTAMTSTPTPPPSHLFSHKELVSGPIRTNHEKHLPIFSTTTEKRGEGRGRNITTPSSFGIKIYFYLGVKPFVFVRAVLPGSWFVTLHRDTHRHTHAFQCYY